MRKTFEINDKEILEHLDDQENQTKYIIRLIRRDMQGTQAIDKNAVIQIIKEYLGDKPEKKQDVQVKNSINNILKLAKS
jgi:hypothetical protein